MYSSVAVGVMVCLMVVVVTRGQPTHIRWTDNQNENWPSNHALLSMLEYDRQEFRTVTSAMNEEIQKFKEVVQSLIDENQNLVKGIEKLQNSTLKLAKDNQKLQNDNKTISDRVVKLETNTELVVFSAYLYLPGNYLRPNSEVIVPFNSTTTNIGGHFSSTTHKFRCPVDGYYLFMYSIQSGNIKQGSHNRTEARLMQGHTEINRVFCHNSNSQSIYCPMSNSAVLLCRENTEVYVNTWGTQIYGRRSRHNTFSGFLLKSVQI